MVHEGRQDRLAQALPPVQHCLSDPLGLEVPGHLAGQLLLQLLEALLRR